MRIHDCILFLSAFLLLAGCVSKKRYLTEINTLRESSENERRVLQYQLDTAQARIYRQELKIAEQSGANQALFITQDKLQDRIDALQEEIERRQASSQAREQSLDAELQARQAEIMKKESQLQELGALLERQNTEMQAVVDSALSALAPLDPAYYNVTLERGEISIALTEQILFQPGSTSRLKSPGIEALERISAVLTTFPSLKVWVIGHTDNRPVQRRSIEDNWEYSALRAVTVVQLLTKEFDISTSRITAAGKGAFAPVASNETVEGQLKNRRIELLIRPDDAQLARAIRQRLR